MAGWPGRGGAFDEPDKAFMESLTSEQWRAWAGLQILEFSRRLSRIEKFFVGFQAVLGAAVVVINILK